MLCQIVAYVDDTNFVVNSDNENELVEKSNIGAAELFAY